MKVTAAAALFAGLAAAGPVELAERQSCPKVYIFGARETTLPQSNGYGTAAGLVNSVKSAYPGAGSEAIVYPACGGGSACGGISYDNSASQGTAAVVKAVTAYNQKCPSTQIVLIGYSQVRNIPQVDSKSLKITRADKSWTTPSAVAQVPLLPATHSRPSRPPFSWATHITATACPTMSEHARPKAYVQYRYLFSYFKLM
jgi:hypothetical protein